MPSLPFHFGFGEVLIGLRQVGLLDLTGVVGGGENLHAVADPFPMRGDRRRNEVAQNRRLDRLQELLAVHAPPSPRRRSRTRRHRSGRRAPRSTARWMMFSELRAPDLRLDAVFLLEGGGQRRHVVDRRRRVDREACLPSWRPRSASACGRRPDSWRCRTGPKRARRPSLEGQQMPVLVVPLDRRGRRIMAFPRSAC